MAELLAEIQRQSNAEFAGLCDSVSSNEKMMHFDVVVFFSKLILYCAQW